MAENPRHDLTLEPASAKGRLEATPTGCVTRDNQRSYGIVGGRLSMLIKSRTDLFEIRWTPHDHPMISALQP